MKNKKNQAGVAGVFLCELLVCMTIVMALSASMAVNMTKVMAAKNFTHAKERLRLVADAISAEAICNSTPSCIPSPALMNIIPNPGIIVSDGYIYNLVNNGPGAWTYTATPIRDGFSGAGSAMVGANGVLHCEPVGSITTVGPNSRTCQ